MPPLRSGDKEETHLVVLLEGEDEVDEQRQHGASVPQTCFNLINVFMGIGCVDFPLMFRWLSLGMQLTRALPPCRAPTKN